MIKLAICGWSCFKGQWPGRYTKFFFPPILLYVQLLLYVTKPFDIIWSCEASFLSVKYPTFHNLLFRWCITFLPDGIIHVEPIYFMTVWYINKNSQMLNMNILYTVLSLINVKYSACMNMWSHLCTIWYIHNCVITPTGCYMYI